MSYSNIFSTSKAEAKKSVYVTSCFLYGFLCLCYMIGDYAQEENYEECKIILDALQSVNKELGMDLPTVYDDKAKAYFEKAILKMTGSSGGVYYTNMDYYIQEIKNKINAIT